MFEHKDSFQWCTWQISAVPYNQGLDPYHASLAQKAPGMRRSSRAAKLRLLLQHAAVQVMWAASMVWAI